jgi:cell division protein FtsB
MNASTPPVLRALLRRLPTPLRNKYLFALTVFFVLLTFFDRQNLWTQLSLRESIRRLESDKDYYRRKISEARLDAQNMNENKEQFARERYHMHKKNEDVFIVQRK